MTQPTRLEVRANMQHTALIERLRDANTELTPADRHALLRLIELLSASKPAAVDKEAVAYQVETSMGWVDAGNKWQAFQSQGRNVRALYAAPVDKGASKPADDDVADGELIADLIEQNRTLRARLAAYPAAPSVEQDERAVIVELLKRARYVRHDDLPAEAQKDAETRAAYGNSSAWQDARDHEQRRLINEAIERLEARAASTSANAAAPAQLGEPDIKALVNRFLAWPLPQTVAADGCATNSSYAFPRSGTNLLNADEAEAMLRYVLAVASPEKGGSENE